MKCSQIGQKDFLVFGIEYVKFELLSLFAARQVGMIEFLNNYLYCVLL